MSVLSHALENYESALNLVEFFLKGQLLHKTDSSFGTSTNTGQFCRKICTCKQNCELLTNS